MQEEENKVLGGPAETPLKTADNPNAPGVAAENLTSEVANKAMASVLKNTTLPGTIDANEKTEPVAEAKPEPEKKPEKAKKPEAPKKHAAEPRVGVVNESESNPPIERKQMVEVGDLLEPKDRVDARNRRAEK